MAPHCAELSNALTLFHASRRKLLAVLPVGAALVLCDAQRRHCEGQNSISCVAAQAVPHSPINPLRLG